MANQAQDSRIVDDEVNFAEVGGAELKEGLALICEDPLVDHPEGAAASAVVAGELLVDSDIGRRWPVKLVKVERAVAVAHDDFEESERADELVSACELASGLEPQKGGSLD